MDLGKLIKLVEKNECVYNPMDRHYMDVCTKNATWEAVGKEMEYPASVCKAKWGSLRDSLRRFLKKRKNLKNAPHCSTRNIARKWRYEDEMQFLLPHLLPRHDDDIFVETENGDEQSASWMTRDETDTTTSTTNIEEFATKKSNGFEEFPEKRSMSENIEEPPKKISKSCVTTESPATILMKHVLGKTEKPVSSSSPMDLFLSGVGETIKSFPPLYQHMAKTKIFNIISDIEMQVIMILKKSEDSQSNEKTLRKEFRPKSVKRECASRADQENQNCEHSSISITSDLSGSSFDENA